MFAFLCQNRCVLCHGPADASHVCSGCLNDLACLAVRADAVCPTCAAFSASGAMCGACQRTPPPSARLWASARYRAPLPDILHHWKHLHQSAMLHPLRELMLANPPPWLHDAHPSRPDCVLAMPLSRDRRLLRGFNQSDELAAAAADLAGLPLLPHDTVSRRHTVPQSTLKKDDRRKNVRGIFSLSGCRAVQNVKTRKILLIDDVFTTGASIFELAKTLRRAGAAEISVWVAARNM